MSSGRDPLLFKEGVYYGEFGLLWWCVLRILFPIRIMFWP